MKLAKVTFKHPVQFTDSSREALTATMAPDLRFEQGFVHFSDKHGDHLVPVTNVKRMTKAKAKEE